MKKILAFVSGSLVAVSLLFAFAPSLVSAQNDIQKGACQGVNLSLEDANSCDPNSQATKDANQAAVSKVNSTIKLVINMLSFIVGVAAVIMIIVGGLRYVTSNGDAGNISSAKNTIMYAVIGLVVVAMAQFVVRFVLTKLSAPPPAPASIIRTLHK